MITDLFSKDISELYRTPIVQQTSFWSILKKRLGVTTNAADFKPRRDLLCTSLNRADGSDNDLLIMVRPAGSLGSIAYVPYGPEFEPDPEYHGAFLEELAESLRSLMPSDCFMIRFDLCWESYWAKDESFFDRSGEWMGEPEPFAQEIRFNSSTLNGNFRRALSNVLPSNTVFIDLLDDEESIINRMKPKTRYNIKLAGRRGVEVRVADIDELDVWYDLYNQTAKRNGIFINDVRYFRELMSVNSYGTGSPAVALLLIAEIDSIPLASMFLILSSGRASYLYGASSDMHRNMMAPYALQWRAIQIAKEYGCYQYDMFGVSPNSDASHPLSGLYRFKSGFGGDIFHSLGCWDYPFDIEKYNLFRTNEMTVQGYHLA